MPYKDKDAQRAYQRQWVATRRKNYLAGKTCRCGSTDKLEFHHRDPEQKLSHKVWSWAVDRLEAELEKCDVLCLSCHRDETAKWRRARAERKNPCGTNGAYHRGCRCVYCKDAHAKKCQFYRERDRIPVGRQLSLEAA